MFEWTQQTSKVLFIGVENKKIEVFDKIYRETKEFIDFHSFKSKITDGNREMLGILNKLDVIDE